MRKTVRESLVHGIFYPSNKEELRALFDEAWERQTLDTGASVRENTPPIYILPHAAYDYILPHLMRVFYRLKGRTKSPERILILAPLHREKKEGIVLPPFDLFRTPFADLPTDREALSRLDETRFGEARSHIRMEELPYTEEYSFETLLPPIAYFFPDTHVLPILIGDKGPQSVDALTRVLELLFEENNGLESAILISSNVTGEVDVKNSESQSRLFRELLEKRPSQTEELIRCARAGKISACAAAAVAAVNAYYGPEKIQPLLLDSSRKGEQKHEVVYGTFEYHLPE